LGGSGLSDLLLIFFARRLLVFRAEWFSELPRCLKNRSLIGWRFQLLGFPLLH